MKRTEIYRAYARSLGWSAPLMVIIFVISNVVELVAVDFIHGNLHRPKANAVVMIALFPPMIGLVAVIGSFLTFTLPQFFQALMSDVFVHLAGRRGQLGILLALPLTATLTWYR